MTDWIQAAAILLFVVIIVITCWAEVDIDSNQWKQVIKGTDAGWDAFVALCVSIFGAEVLNLAFWQRIYAAKDAKEIKKGFLVGAALVSLLTFLFGLSCLLLKANDIRQQNECPQEGNAIAAPPFTFFEILDMPSTTSFTKHLVFILALCTIASCADSFQTAITSVISREVIRQGLDDMKGLALGEILVVIVNVPAIAFAIHAAKDTSGPGGGLSVKLTDLFGMADIITITLVIPLFSGLWKFVTPMGSAAGMFMGVLYILVWGWVEYGSFVAGFANLTMMCWGVKEVKPEGYSPYACGPWYAWRSAILFTTIPLVTFVATYGWSWTENMWRAMNKLFEQRGLVGKAFI